MGSMSGVYRAKLNLGKLRTHLFKSERAGRSNDALAEWLAQRGFWRDGDRWLGGESALSALPPGVVTERGEAVQAQPWRDEPLYASIFAIADEQWDFFCRDNEPDSEVWRFVLVEEYVADDGCECAGPVLRAWCRDDAGLREMTESERLDHRGRATGRRNYPFALLTFRIRSGRDRVVLGVRHATTAGTGGQYLVERVGEQLKLTPDPDGGFWVS